MKELLLQFVVLQTLAVKRGYEYINAAGCNFNIYKFPDRFEVTLDSINMTFGEDSGHDCPGSESTSLNLKELEMTDEQWDEYIKAVKEGKLKEYLITQEKEEAEKLAALSKSKLIDAAPDLLAACIAFVEKVDKGKARSTNTYNEMKKAIQKAGVLPIQPSKLINSSNTSKHE